MANLKEVRGRIQSIGSTQQITKAMKMVAAAKLRRAQDGIIQLRPYAEKLNTILGRVSSTLDESFASKYSEQRTVNNVLIVVVTSDRGLCGGFNSSIFKSVQALIADKYAGQMAGGNLELLCVGKKGHEFFGRRDFTINEDFVQLFGDLNFEAAKEAAEYAMNAFESGKYDAIDIVYNEFKNVATQIVCQEQFLPIAKQEAEEGASQENIDYIFEPNKTEIVRDLIPNSLKIQFYKTLLESNASEHGARMTAMDKATENAGELLKELKLVYNRSRQAAITTEILEIVGGAEALAAGQ